MLKKTTIVSSAVFVLAFAASAFAQANTTASTAPVSSSAASSQQMVLQVGPVGKALLRGTIDSVSGSSLAVKSWGGIWTVNVGSSAEILPAAAGNDMTKFKAGDFVGVQGMVSQNGNWSIDATLVRDWTYRQEIVQEQKQNMQAARQTIKSETPKNHQGTASNVSGSSFTLTVDGTAATVNIASGAQVVNRNWITLQPTSIQNGDTVRVWGTSADGTISAQIVRDISIPAASGAAR